MAVVAGAAYDLDNMVDSVPSARFELAGIQVILYLVKPPPDELHGLLLAQPMQIEENVHELDLAVPYLEDLHLPELHLLLILVSVDVRLLLGVVRSDLVAFLESVFDLLQPVLTAVIDPLGFLLSLAVGLLALVVEASLEVEEVELP